MALDARTAAHRILAEVRGGAFADAAAEAILPEVSPRDRGLVLEIAYGCLRLRARLDTRILALTDRPRRRIDPDVLDWLRSGVYELTELRTPAHAAVYETVKLTRREGGRGAAGFVNAVLRAASADPPDPFPDADPASVEVLTTWGSHPEWLVRRWLGRWPRHEVRTLIEHDNVPPPVVVRLLDGGTPGTLPAGVALRPVSGWPRSFELVGGSPAEALAAVRSVVQDPAASAVVDYLGDGFPLPVYDACAAPGTKTAGIAGLTAGLVVAGDVSRRRLARVGATADRLGLPVLRIAADARRPPLSTAGTVLADVPCTGTGVLRRRADARWRIDEAGLEALVGLQREILDGCAKAVREGGVLVYSTCSLEPEENEMQIEAFLRREPGFEREAADVGDRIPAACLTAAGDLFVRPWATGTDGAYAARLRRVR